MNKKREETKEKMLRFLGFLAFLCATAFSAPVHAASYSCATDIEYTSCNSGYYFSSGNCTSCTSVSFSDSKNETCTTSSGSGTKSCTRTCYRTGGAGGTSESSACTGANCGDWSCGECTVASCGDGYTMGSNGCVACTTVNNTSSTQNCTASCSVSNGTCTCQANVGSQTCNGQYTTGSGGSCSGCSSYGTCSGCGTKSISCNNGYYKSGESCLACTSASNTSDTQNGSEECTISNGTGSRTYTNTCNGNYTGGSGGSCSGCSSWKRTTTNTCYVTSCNTGYHENQSSNATSCPANTYTVKYNANGGSGTTADSSHTYDVSKSLTSNGFTNGTKRFLGWSTSSSASSATYSNEQSVSNLTTTNNGTVTLYAVWGNCDECSAGTGANCTLSAPLGVCTYTTSCKGGYYSLSGGGTKSPSCSGVGDKYYSPDGDNTRYDCTTQAGASYTKSDGTRSSKSDCYIPNCSKTCSGNDTNSCPANSTCTYNTSYATTNGTQHYGGSCTSSASLCPVSGFSCVANFFKDGSGCTSCTAVTFDCSGTDATTTSTCPDGTDKSHASGTSQAYDRTCNRTTSNAGSTASSACTGSDYYTNKSYSGKTCYVTSCDTGYHKNQSSNATSCPANTFSVSYNAGTRGSGTAPSSPTTCTYNDTSCKTPSNTYSRIGHKFNNWSCSSNNGTCAKSSYAAGASIGTATTVNGATITLTATWTPRVIHCDAGKYLRASDATCQTCPAGKYCTGGDYTYQDDTDLGISGPCDANTYSTGGASAPSCVSCTTVQYMVRYTSVGNTSTCPDGVTYKFKATGTTQPYDAICFHKTSPVGSTSPEQCEGRSTCGGEVYGTCYVTSCESGYHKDPSTNATSCKPNAYQITYNAGDGASGTNKTQNVTYNASFTTLGANTFSKSNATFDGWSPDAGTYTTANTSYTYTIIGNTTLTATWKCNAGYTLNATTRACDPCAAGTYKGTTGNGLCTPTSAGYFAAGTGNTAQTGCVQGSYTTTTGKTACTPCDRGKTNPAGIGNTSCSANCAAITNLATWQQPAWAPNNTMSVAVCLVETCNPCIKGVGAATCTYNTNNNKCNYIGTCKDGYDIPVANSTTITCTPNNYTITYTAGGGGLGDNVTQTVTFDAKFTTKPANTFGKSNATFIGWWPTYDLYTEENTEYTYVTPNSITMEAQWECNAGYGYDSTTEACNACTPGYYKPNAGNVPCTAASKGYFVRGNAQTAQVACVQGSYTPSTGMSGCTPCDKDKTNVNTGNAACSTDCAPIGELYTWQQPVWATNNTMTIGTCLVETCNTCIKGTGVDMCEYSMDGNVCTYTDTCKPGYNTPIMTGHIASCTPNNYTVTYNAGDGGNGTTKVVHVVFDANFTTEPSNLYHKQNATFAGWLPSAGGYTLPNKEYTYTTVDNITMTALWNCNPGYGLNPTTRNCEPCVPGTYKSAPDNTQCIPATKGHFVDGTAKTFQTACVQGSYTPTTGMSACTVCAGGKTNTGDGNDNCNADCPVIPNLATWQLPIWQLNNTISVETCLVESCDLCVRGVGVASCEYNMDGNKCNYSGVCFPGYNTPLPDGEVITCTPNIYTVTYNAGDGGHGNDATQRVTFDAKFTTKPSDTFDKPNATFVGWEPSAGAYNTANTEYTYVTVGDVTLTALWTCNFGYTLNATTRNCDPCAPGTYKPFDGNEACEVCPENYYCDGTIGTSGDGSTSCTTLGVGDAFTQWLYAPAGSDEREDCYSLCVERDVDYGHAYPNHDTENWPTVCTFTGISDTGNPCKIPELAENKCIESGCHSNFEMIDGVCELCEREHATSYERTGNCIIAQCETGYHPYGDACVGNEFDCTETIPNATLAQRVWNETKLSFDICRVQTCEDGYHVASNACIPDEEACAVPHGIGTRTWNVDTNAWNQCVPTSCDAGYTDDNDEKKNRSEPCSECKNKYAENGDQAVSSYVRGCEIASCMYQGEKYALDGDECVPICTDSTDEFGNKKHWNPRTQKCEFECQPGYVPW